MTFKEVLIQYRENTDTAYLTFLINYKNAENCFHLFYEGNDDASFYTNFLDNILLAPKHVYNCKGKKRLHHIYKLINWSAYSKKKIIFFTDKDYSDILSETWNTDYNIFVTTPY